MKTLSSNCNRYRTHSVRFDLRPLRLELKTMQRRPNAKLGCHGDVLNNSDCRMLAILSFATQFMANNIALT